jgi:hypothetical protein
LDVGAAVFLRGTFAAIFREEKRADVFASDDLLHTSASKFLLSFASCPAISIDKNPNGS